MADILFKGKIDEYQDKLTTLNTCISQMENLRSRYQTHLGQLTNVMDSTDSNFDKLYSAAEQNIQALSESIKLAQSRREAVEAAIQGMSEITDTAGGMLNQMFDTAVAGVTAAVKTGKLLG